MAGCGDAEAKCNVWGGGRCFRGFREGERRSTECLVYVPNYFKMLY